MPIFYIIELSSLFVLALIIIRIIRPNGFKRRALAMAGGVLAATVVIYGGAIIGMISKETLAANIHYLVFASVMVSGILAAIVR